MKNKDMNKKQKKFLEYYAKTLDFNYSLQLAGYKSDASIESLKKMIVDNNKSSKLTKVISELATRLEVTKAFVVRKYLKLVNHAFFEDEGGLKDPQLALRALDGLCKQLSLNKIQETKSDSSIFADIEGLDSTKI